jgi:hypothetical protein
VIRESLLLAAAGGLAGVLLGALVTAGYAASQGWQAVVPPLAIGGGLLAAAAIGALAGLTPRCAPPACHPPTPSDRCDHRVARSQRKGCPSCATRATWSRHRSSARTRETSIPYAASQTSERRSADARRRDERQLTARASPPRPRPAPHMRLPHPARERRPPRATA